MIYQLSKNFANTLKDHLQLAEDDLDQYIFGIEIFFVTLIKWGGLLGVGALLGNLTEAFIFTIAFTLLRNRAGGLHFQSFYKCFFITLVLMISSIYIVQIIPSKENHLLMLLLLSLTILLVFIYAPIDTPNKPLREEEKEIYRKQSRYIVLFLSILTLTFTLFIPAFLPYGTIISLSCFLEAITLPLGAWKNKKVSIEA